ncbi:hypothetical protein BDW02DRAFT_564866 [Decorospora gaudefroyi]|uniref:Myb-like domain-containing protein n=1 Tax=Decorospora gaudefroyi TaxID=184978 RepID=A0A6A5KUB1_9PLEO|nr:hypothetical protein BDW02DRAFT_564866 [Decorospora gaudefroyi]
MESRMAAIPDSTSQEGMSYIADTLSLAVPSAQNPRPAELTSIGQKALMQPNVSPGHSKAEDLRKEAPDRTFATRAMPSAPIAQVLNEEAKVLNTTQPGPSSFTFSGRLVDLLLDSPEHTKQRWDQEQQFVQPDLTGFSPSVIKLPRLPQPPKRTAKRPRIPPLLQGLHQPPPLPPEGRLFPPITGEKNAFAQIHGERGYDTVFEDTRNKDVDEHPFLEGVAIDLTKTVPHGENTPTCQAAAPSASSSGAAVNRESGLATSKDTETQSHFQRKRGKKRNKWSEQETKDLLVGVSKFGIGNWKKILHHSDFAFNNRTAVDLKDRFRVCCPGEGLKLRQPKSTPKSKEKVNKTLSGLPQENTHRDRASNLSSHQKNNSNKTAPASQAAGHERESARNKTLPDLVELGISEPFLRTTRRPRRAFSACDDVNLLKGFEKYGPVWHNIRDDTELEFTTRHPTDLRDRFRIRYPEKYVQAGYKLKAKEGRDLEKRAQQGREGEQERPEHPHSTTAQPPHRAETSPSHNENIAKESQYSTGIPTTATTTAPSFVPLNHNNTSLKPFASTTYLSDPLPTLPFNDDYDDDDNNMLHDVHTRDESPITLSRNILRWADANPSSLYAVNAPAPSTYPSKHNAHPLHDALHASNSSTTAATTVGHPPMEGSRGSNSLLEAEAWSVSEKGASERMQLPVVNYLYR